MKDNSRRNSNLCSCMCNYFNALIVIKFYYRCTNVVFLMNKNIRNWTIDCFLLQNISYCSTRVILCCKICLSPVELMFCPYPLATTLLTHSAFFGNYHMAQRKTNKVSTNCYPFHENIIPMKNRGLICIQTPQVFSFADSSVSKAHHTTQHLVSVRPFILLSISLLAQVAQIELTRPMGPISDL